MKKTVWFDITNTPQVHFLHGISRILGDKEYNFMFTARDFSETLGLLEQKIGKNFEVIGTHHGKSRVRKIIGLGVRLLKMSNLVKEYDISLSNGSENAIWLSKLKRRPSIAFGDNDLAKQWTYSRFVNHSFFPTAIDPSILDRQGLKNKYTLYEGFKEDIYLSSFTPDPKFFKKLPFNEYIVLRAENLQANYVSNSSTKSIIPEILELLLDKGINIVFLPRYNTDRKLIKTTSQVFIPDGPIDGLNLVYYSSGVFTGAGTLAREAACMGLPSFSFFAGERLLSVDKKLVNEGKMYFSRNPNELVNEFLRTKLNRPDLSLSKINAKKLEYLLKRKISELV